MLELGIMVEGQNGVTWSLWRDVVAAAEDLGYTSLFRSDHFTNPQGPDKPSLALWPSLTYAAMSTRRIRFGPLVSPVTFRHPSLVARDSAAIDDLSGGRMVLGLGAGWQKREHELFGVPFPEQKVRYVMLREALEVVSRLFQNDDPAIFAGQYYQLNNAVLLPRPGRAGGPTLLVGGNGPRRTLPLAAEYAQEWNANFISAEEFHTLNHRLDQLLTERGRDPKSVKRSIMLGTFYAESEEELIGKLQSRGRTLDEMRDAGVIAGTVDMWRDQLIAYRDAGAQEVMLQWLDLENLAPLETIARDVLPAVSGA